LIDFGKSPVRKREAARGLLIMMIPANTYKTAWFPDQVGLFHILAGSAIIVGVPKISAMLKILAQAAG
jgi:hypothetical protein